MGIAIAENQTKKNMQNDMEEHKDPSLYSMPTGGKGKTLHVCQSQFLLD